MIAETAAQNKPLQLVDFGWDMCPVCNTHQPFDDYCANPDCAYVTNDDIRAVVDSLISSESDWDTVREIVEFMARFDAPTAERKAFAIDTREKVEWYLAKLAAWDAYVAETQTEAQRMIDAINARTESITKPVRNQRDAFAAHFEPDIIAFARQDMATLNRSSAKFLNGEIKVTKTGAKLVFVKDETEDLAMEWLIKERIDLLNVKYTPKAKELREAWATLPPTVQTLATITEPGENVHIKPMMVLEVQK